MKKKLFAVLMSAVMMVSFMPAMAFAAENENESGTVKFALNAENLVYDGTAKTPQVSGVQIWNLGDGWVDVKTEGRPSKATWGERYYTVSCLNNINAGNNAVVTVNVYRYLVGWDWVGAKTKTFTIEKGNPFSTEPQARNLVANGEMQDLLTAPVLKNKNTVVRYSLDGGKNWDNKIPQAKEINTYNVTVSIIDLTGNYTYEKTFVSTIVAATPDEQLFNEYKAVVKKNADDLKKDGDSKHVDELIDAVKKAIDAAQYDTTKTLAENKAVLDNMVVELKTKVEAQRVLDADSAAVAAKVAKVKIVQKKAKAYKNGKIKVTVKGAKYDGKKITKYQIYRATKKNGKYKRVKTVTSKKKTVTYKNSKKLKKGKKYYYKVRGYVVCANGDKAYTQWSKIKSVKCKRTRK